VSSTQIDKHAKDSTIPTLISQKRNDIEKEEGIEPPLNPL
jgi:hypothetical protein